jgi:hypothetical protein
MAWSQGPGAPATFAELGDLVVVGKEGGSGFQSTCTSGWS